MLCRLRGTIAGAYNRLDLLSLVTCGVDENDMSNGTEGIVAAVEGWQENETHDPDIPAVSHRRGMQPFVFIPFEEVMVFTLFFLFLAVIYDYILHLLVLNPCIPLYPLQVDTSVLNLPVEQMDFYVPG